MVAGAVSDGGIDQGCGLGLDSRKTVNVSVMSRSGPFTSRAQDQWINSFLMGMQMAAYAV